MKGDHYFDFVSDVLSKVIAEPNLLKLEVVETKVGGSNEEDAETGSNKDGQPDNHHHRYLKHRASTNNGDHMKCVVFYTSLVHKGKSCNLRELKSLPGNSVGKVDVHAVKKQKTEIKKRIQMQIEVKKKENRRRREGKTKQENEPVFMEFGDKN